MSAKFLAILNGSQSYSFTAPNNGKIAISACTSSGSQGVSVNGAYIYYYRGTTAPAEQGSYATYFYIGAGQNVVIKTENSAVYAVVSYYEG